MRKHWRLILQNLVLGLLLAGLLSGGQPMPLTPEARAALVVEGQTYDFTLWTLHAVWFKLEQASLGLPGYLTREARKQAVTDYFRLTGDVMQAEQRLQTLYSDPSVTDVEQSGAALRARLDVLRAQQAAVQPLAESVMEAQVSEVMAAEGLAFLGQPIPPVLAHITPLPYDLVVSPRDHIEQKFAFMLRPDITVDDAERLEARMDAALDVSSLVVPIGGLGAYPTMVQRTTNLRWTLETFAHEWTHNYLNWHPLGIRYGDSPALRTMNETTANIVGKEVGERILAAYYPEQAGALWGGLQTVSWHGEHRDPRDWPRPVFDFRAEMHATRIRVDDLLAQGRIAEAEAYMEQRRQFFWWMGYHIRKINQAYFAFYGAYADVPGGAAGEDPVGPAVRTLRARSASLGDFVRRMAGLHDFAELQAVLAHDENK